MSQFELTVGEYQGPLEKLLELIEAHELAVSEVSMAAVTDDFLKYLQTLPAVAPAVLADFLTVASRLVLIKSKTLLPELPLTEEEESDIRDLERRLETYRQLKAAEKHVGALWRSGNRAASRPYLFHASNLPPVFHPGRTVTAPALAEAFARLYAALERFTMETTTVEETMVSLEEKMKEIAERMASVQQSSLHGLAAGRARTEIVVLFLAILHLAREGRVALAQDDQFSDIIVKKL